MITITHNYNTQLLVKLILFSEAAFMYVKVLCNYKHGISFSVSSETWYLI